ncbi:MAG: hypothetical protein IJ785_00090 [Bacteroidales bacterium]|nr:hypothetical protein [Bacteroidales bacterium]
MEKDFDELWNECLRTAQKKQCPIPDDRLEQMIARAIQQPQPLPADTPASNKPTVSLWRKPWFRAAAAILLLILIPATLIHRQHIDTATIAYGGQSLHFRSNTDCNPAKVVDLVVKYIDPQPDQPTQVQTATLLGPSSSKRNNLISFR